VKNFFCYGGVTSLGGIVLTQNAHFKTVKVIETIPACNQVVSYTLDKISIKFSSPMNTGSYSIVTTGEGETPELISKPVFEDKYTFIMHVKLKPNTLYSFGVNSKTKTGFTSEEGIPAEPFILTFKTQSQEEYQLTKRVGENTKEASIQQTSEKDVKKTTSCERNTIIYNFYIDNTQGAFWLLVPNGWKVEGGVSEALFQGPKFNFALTHPYGWGSIRFIPGARYLHMPSQTFMPPGSVDQYGNVYMPFMEPTSYLRQICVPNLYSSGVKEIDGRELPHAAQALKHFYELIGVAVPQIRVAELTLESNKENRIYFDRLIVYVTITPIFEGGIWETQLLQVSALKEKLAETEPILMSTLSSFQINPYWVVAKNRAEMLRAEIRMRYQQEILEIQERMYKNRAHVNEEISNSIGLELADQAHFVDTKTGEMRTLNSSYDKTWTNGNGTFIQSNDPNFNPNNPEIQREIGISGEFRTMIRK